MYCGTQVPALLSAAPLIARFERPPLATFVVATAATRSWAADSSVAYFRPFAQS